MGFARLPLGVTLNPSAALNATPLGDKPACGSPRKTCSFCRKAERDTRESISNGMRLIRIRYGIPYSELPDLKPAELNRHLGFLLLVGQERPSVVFPRRQRPGTREDGFLPLERLWKRQRWELAHSLASLKRNLPPGCRFCSQSQHAAWAARATKPPPPLPDGYLAFARKIVRQSFPLGWDANYESFVDRFVPRASSRYCRGRADQLCAALGEGTFRRKCLTGRGFCTSPLKARYKEVLSAGKVRPLTIFEWRNDLLGPLHSAIHSHLATRDWLLSGPPTNERVSSVLVYEYQTSVDLVSATDNLSLPVASAILECLLAKASRIPFGIRVLACNSLYPIVDVGEGMLEVTNGQMMGSYLSFPLLCLQSYIAARWATRDVEANILVNGDDTLISSSRVVTDSDYPCNFIINSDKTIRCKNVAEINSTCFLLDGRRRWSRVDHLRRGSFLSDYSGMLHAAAAVRSSPSWSGALVRSRIGKKWGFLPSQLGLNFQSYPVYSRERELLRKRVYTRLPTDRPAVQEGLLQVIGVAAQDERLALAQWLRANGRPVDRRISKPMTVGRLRRSYRYLRVEPKSFLTYKVRLALEKLDKEVSQDVYFVPDEYISYEENARSRRAHLWKQGCESA